MYVNLACRMYKIDSEIIEHFKKILEDNSEMKYYDYPCGDKEILPLAIIIKKYAANTQGHSVLIDVDLVTELNDRDRPNPFVRYHETFEIQIFENMPPFNNCMAIFGPKHIDNKLIKAVKLKLSSDGIKSAYQFKLLKVSFTPENIDAISNEYPNIQHYCVKDVPDDQIEGIIVKGVQLENNDLFERFVKDEIVKGTVNFLGITIDSNKMIYVSRDGSIFSRKNFARTDKIQTVFTLYSSFHRLNVFIKSLSDF